MDALAELPWQELAGGALVALAAFLIGNALALWAVLVLPADYFSTRYVAAPRHRALVIARSALGVLLIPIGLVMCLPGVIGPGLLTVLIGVMLVESPWRRAWERRLIAVPSLRRAIDALRLRFGRPPLQLDD